MIDLKNISGLPIFLDEEKLSINFREEFLSIKKSERTLKELAPYLKNPEDLSGPNPAYYIWREAYLKEDGDRIKSRNLRYDLTLLAPGKIGKEEFVKTAGHYHALKSKTGFTYPEVYEVLYGCGYFLIQQMDESFLTVKDVLVIEAEPGEKVLIPPGFGHVTINVFEKPLLVANWVSTLPDYNYKPFERHRGGAYYFIENEFGAIDIVKNENYDDAPEIKKFKAVELSEFGLIKSKPMYNLARDIEKLRFLNYPEKFIRDIDVRNVYPVPHRKPRP